MSEITEELNNTIRARIRELGQITFAEFMGLALYAPGTGYYARRPNLIGARGDFYTAPHLTPIFGELLARQLVELWEQAGQPANFQLIEMGAGQGLLAGDILTWLKFNKAELWDQFTYSIIELSDFLIEGQKRRLRAISKSDVTGDLLEKVSWCRWQDLPVGSVEGVFFSNELVDAFPVHLVQLEQGQLREIYVTANEQGQFQEVTGVLSTPAIADYFTQAGLNLTNGEYEEGYRTEVNLAALEWLTMLATKLKRGYILTIDYGYTGQSRYHPRRSGGTLQCYSNHTISYNPYVNVGQQDITSHVDFSGLVRKGEQLGLETVGFTSQAAFLAGLGIGDKLMELNDTQVAAKSGKTAREIMTERQALQKLVMPHEMGNFGVLLQRKAVNETSTLLSGFSLKI